MLSYLDEATAAVQRFGLQAKFPDGSARKTYALHFNPSNEVSFRISPVNPPPGLSENGSASVQVAVASSSSPS